MSFLRLSPGPSRRVAKGDLARNERQSVALGCPVSSARRAALVQDFLAASAVVLLIVIFWFSRRGVCRFLLWFGKARFRCSFLSCPFRVCRLGF